MYPDWGSLGERYSWGEFLFRQGDLVGRESVGDLLGVGVFFTGFGPRPLLLANTRLIREERARPYRMFTLPQIDEGTRDSLYLEEPPEDLLVMFVEPPQPLAGVDPWVPRKVEVISSATGELGTLGPRVELEDYGTAFMTAGHLLGGIGSPVDLVSRSLSDNRHLRLGEVVFRADPADTGAPGYDVGLIRPEMRVKVLRHQIAHLGQDREAPFPATIWGGRSGVGHGFIQGALMVHSDVEGVRRWVNSWMLMPGSIGAEGDSGATVTGPGGAVVGMQVGGTRVSRSRSFAVLYVHDLAAALAELF